MRRTTSTPLGEISAEGGLTIIGGGGGGGAGLIVMLTFDGALELSVSVDTPKKGKGMGGGNGGRGCGWGGLMGLPKLGTIPGPKELNGGTIWAICADAVGGWA
jgi:hypothetical protein